MDRSLLVATSLVVLVSLAGCSMFDSPDPNFELSLDAGDSTEVVAGEEYAVSGLVENTGNGAGSYDLVFAVNGIEQETKTVDLEPGESERVEFTHVIERPGNYTVSVNGVESTVTAVSRLDAAADTMDGTPAYATEERVEMNLEAEEIAEGERAGERESISYTSEAAAVYNRDAETMRFAADTGMRVGESTFGVNETQWYVDGVLYSRESNMVGETRYDARTTEFETVDTSGDLTELLTSIETYTVEAEGNRRVYSVDRPDANITTQFLRTVKGYDEGFISEDAVVVDSNLDLVLTEVGNDWRLTEMTMSMTFEGAEDSNPLEGTADVHVNVTEYNAPSNVTVPEEVTTNLDDPNPPVYMERFEGDIIAYVGVMDGASEIIIEANGEELARLENGDDSAVLDVDDGETIDVYATAPWLDERVHIFSDTPPQPS